MYIYYYVYAESSTEISPKAKELELKPEYSGHSCILLKACVLYVSYFTKRINFKNYVKWFLSDLKSCFSSQDIQCFVVFFYSTVSR